MSEPVNLNKFRKAKAKADKERKARENRAKFGRTKAEKQIDKARAEKLSKLTEGHRLKDKPGTDS
jgi:sRNA-binding protein